MADLLNITILSEKRRNLLILLSHGPRTWDEIKTELNVTATGMLPQIKILEEEHLLEREGKKYALSPMGKVIVSHMKPFVRTANVFSRHKKFWQEHAIGELPQEILADIGDLGNYYIIENKDEEIFDVNTFLKNISQAKQIKGISHTIHPKYPTFFLELAKRGAVSSLILTPGVFKITKEQYHDLLQEYLNCESTSLYVSKQDIKFSFTVTDSYFSLSLFYNNGVFDSKNDVISHDPSALTWGERIFSYYQKQSENIETLD
jgi:predicted transcriptional regulator